MTAVDAATSSSATAVPSEVASAAAASVSHSVPSKPTNSTLSVPGTKRHCATRLSAPSTSIGTGSAEASLSETVKSMLSRPPAAPSESSV